jgi:hypothetical protein
VTGPVAGVSAAAGGDGTDGARPSRLARVRADLLWDGDGASFEAGDMRAAVAEVDRLRGSVEVAAAERTAAFLELMDLRTEAAVLRARVAELEAQAADHPLRVARLTGECEEWADRCGAAEADLEALRDRAAAVLAGWDRADAAWRSGPLPAAVAELRAELRLVAARGGAS